MPTLDKVTIPDSGALIDGGATPELMGVLNSVKRFTDGTRKVLREIPDDNLAGGQRRYIVENQTTNDPPSSPSAGEYWIVGSSPTGAWAGKAGYIATKYSYDSGWTFITPIEGHQAYDKSANADYIFTGSVWSQTGNAWAAVAHVRTDGTGSTTATLNTDWGGTSAPSSTTSRRADDATITATVTSGKIMRFSYSARLVPSLTTAVTGGSGVNAIKMGIAIFRDSETTAFLWRPINSGLYLDTGSALSLIEGPYFVDARFIWTADDSSSHTYKAAVLHAFGAHFSVGSLSERDFTLEVST